MGYEYPCHVCNITTEVTTVGSRDLCHTCLLAYVASLEGKRDDAEGALASICDLVNTACRETGVDESHNYLEPTGGPIKRAVERVVHRLRSSENASLLRRDRLKADLAEAVALLRVPLNSMDSDHPFDVKLRAFLARHTETNEGESYD